MLVFLQTATDGDPFGQLVDLGVAGVVIGAMFLAIRLMWSRLEAVTDRFLEHLEEKDRNTASALQSVVDNLQRLEGAMDDHERRAEERHTRALNGLKERV
jgi:hypothetical protein